MDDLSKKISEIMSDPQALQQIQGLGEMLGLSNQKSELIHNTVQNSDNSQSSNIGFDNQKMMGLMTKFAPILGNINKDDDTTKLLVALRPFLSAQRQKKLDEAAKLIKMMKLLPLIKDTNLLDSLF